MKTTELTALRPENPVAMMAAYGALRLLPGAQMRWPGEHPELHWEGDVVAALATCLPQRMAAPEVNLIDDPRDKGVGGVAGYRELARKMPHEWLAALACEGVDGIVGTGLRAHGGNHKFNAAARQVMRTLAQLDVPAKLKEALFGPWRYEDSAGAALGWDAGARLDAAALAHNPLTKDKLTILAATWLAWEALPGWTMINGRTPGVLPASKRTRRNKRWTYPTCAEWLSWQGVHALVVGLERMTARECRALGVRRWETEIDGRPEGGEWSFARTVSDGAPPGGSRSP
jgi:hypothetical protein